jgi:hypothetical protein
MPNVGLHLADKLVNIKGRCKDPHEVIQKISRFAGNRIMPSRNFHYQPNALSFVMKLDKSIFSGKPLLLDFDED